MSFAQGYQVVANKNTSRLPVKAVNPIGEIIVAPVFCRYMSSFIGWST